MVLPIERWKNPDPALGSLFAVYERPVVRHCRQERMMPPRLLKKLDDSMATANLHGGPSGHRDPIQSTLAA